MAYVTIKPEMIKLDENLEHLGLTHDQLIVVGILIGTDFNLGIRFFLQSIHDLYVSVVYTPRLDYLTC